MSYIFTSKKISIFLILFAFLITKSHENKEYIFKKLKHYSIKEESFSVNQSYIYYLDIHSYKLGTENIFQILDENIDFINNLTVSEIDESIIFDNTSEITIKETFLKTNHIKLRPKPKKYYFEVLIKKTREDQKYFVILLEPNITQNTTGVNILVSSIIPEITLRDKDISNGNIYSRETVMDTKIERFTKFIFHNISLEKSNIILFVSDKGVSNFYLQNITSQMKRTRLLILTKNSTQETEHIIYFSLIGPANKTKINIILDDHDIIYKFSRNRQMTNFYIERLNCTKDIYIFEDYSLIKNDNEKKAYHLDINSIYGEYEMIYYEIISSNISNIFHPDNNSMIILNENNITKITSESNVLKFSCKKPTLLKVRYLDENIDLTLEEGQEKMIHYDKCQGYYKVFSGKLNKINKVGRKYKFYFGYYKLQETEEKINTLISTDFKGYFTENYITKNDPYFSYDIYYDKGSSNKSLRISGDNDNLYYKAFLISNQYYKNVIEGVTEINFNEKSIAVKIRKDLVYDYFLFKAYSHDKSIKISLEYDLKIIEKEKIYKDKVLVGMDPVKDYLKNELILKYSNPYDKFNSKIKEDDFVYLLVIFISPNNSFPIYTDIRYYYNNSIITLEPNKPEILVNNKKYKIFGDQRNNDEIEKILLNINKCNVSKNYTIKTFYENNDNLILNENIIDERTFLLHDNLFNNTKILINAQNQSNNLDNIEENKMELASYFKNGDLYMNYIPINEELYNNLNINKDFSISFEDSYNLTYFKWNEYFPYNTDKYPVNYSIYILPKTSPINSICQMSLIPPNITLINKNNYELSLKKGEYKISIIASIANENFPLTTYYDFLEFDIPTKYNIKLIIIFTVCSFVIIVGTLSVIIYCKKKKKNDLKVVDITRKSRLLSALGLEVENEEGLILDNDDEDEENDNLIDKDKKEGELTEKENDANFSRVSEK